MEIQISHLASALGYTDDRVIEILSFSNDYKSKIGVTKWRGIVVEGNYDELLEEIRRIEHEHTRVVKEKDTIKPENKTVEQVAFQAQRFQEQEMPKGRNEASQSEYEPLSDNQHYEYKTEMIRVKNITKGAQEIEAALNNYALEGWRLKDSITTSLEGFGGTLGSYTILVFERLVKK